jgi:nucleotidyltransferase/DNA polymerase involved in DNA repair
MRVICHIDLDAFYVQVERVLQRVPLGPTEPCAVVQYNEFAGGGIIALSYEAKRLGVKRNMRGDEARRLVPEIKLVTVPVAHEKADLTVYRDAGTTVFELLDRQGAVCERTSIDEAYVDISDLAAELAAHGAADPPTDEDLTGCHVLGVEDAAVPSWVRRYTDGSVGPNNGDETDEHRETLLAAGAVVAARLRALVRRETRYTMSAGVAENKLLAKHASGMHKPYAQTVVRPAAVPSLMASIDLTNLNGLGGKKGEAMKQAHEGISKVADLQRFTREQLARDFPGISPHSSFISWLYDACRGVCHKPVERRLYMDSVSCFFLLVPSVAPCRSLLLHPSPQRPLSSTCDKHCQIECICMLIWALAGSVFGCIVLHDCNAWTFAFWACSHHTRLHRLQVGNSKTFRGPAMLSTLADVRKYLGLLSEEVWDRLQTYKSRYGVRPSHASVYFSQGSSQVTRKGEVVSVSGGEGKSASRSFPLAAELTSADDLARRVIAAAETCVAHFIAIGTFALEMWCCCACAFYCEHVSLTAWSQR